jgi:DNA gyrase subunit A
VIALIRAAKVADQARDKLMKKFKLTSFEAQAILDLPLKRLASLERKKIEQEYKDLLELIKELTALLKSETKRRGAVIQELNLIKQKFAYNRKTHIVQLTRGKVAADLLTVREVTPVEKVWICLTRDGRLAKTAEANQPRLGGREAPLMVINTDSHQNLYIAARTGKCACVSVQALPLVESPEQGLTFSRVTPFGEEEKPVFIFCLSLDEKGAGSQCITTLTRQGMIKRSLVSELPGPSSDLFTLCKVNEGDELGWGLITGEEHHLLLITKNGMSIRFTAQEVRAMGLVAAGVNAMKLSSTDEAAGMLEVGFPLQGRYGQGVITCRLKPGSYVAGFTCGKKNTQISLHFKKAAAKLIRLDDVPLCNRATQGKPALEIKAGDEIERIVMVRAS